MIVSGDTPSDISKSVGIGFIGFSEAYKDIKPDLIIVLGDRYELLAASYTANILEYQFVIFMGEKVPKV